MGSQGRFSELGHFKPKSAQNLYASSLGKSKLVHFFFGSKKYIYGPVSLGQIFDPLAIGHFWHLWDQTGNLKISKIYFDQKSEFSTPKDGLGSLRSQECASLRSEGVHGRFAP